MELTITQPDDWHLHLRDGALLEAVTPHSAKHFGRAIVMPNLKPPITTTAAAIAYRESILKAVPKTSNFTPLMTLYLTDITTPEEIKLAKRSGFVYGVKLYPAGATTNSQDGVTDLFGNCYSVLEEMVEQDLPLLVHGEVTNPEVDVFDREKVYIETILEPLVQRLPQLKVVMEHITTMDAVKFVQSCKEGHVAATVTPQHLLLNRNSLFQGGLQPHNYCLPVLKREIHRQAIVSAVTSGSKRFFLGTDSAPHDRRKKECPCGCAGIYSSPVALSLYAKVFEEHVFKMEQEEYKKEEIDWSYIEFVDNQDILDLIEKKPGGIIALLDEACMFPRSTHETFAQKLYQTFKNHKRFNKPKLSRSDFTICHYAGDVTYQTDLFLDKNKDYVVAEHQALLYASTCPFVSGLFPPSPEESSNKSKFSSIGSRFKQQLQSLLETLSSTEPHYIRCVKPNNLLKPGIFENKNVLQQLRCGGVMEAIRISCAGYPTRKTFDEFVDRFGLLAPEALDGSSDEVSACQRILEKIGLKGYQIGKTKVFLRAGQMAELDTYRSEILGKSASIIQRKVRSYLARRSFVSIRLSVVQIQAVCRGQLARQIYEGLRREASSLVIQRNVRMHTARKAYKELCSSAISIQTGMRGMAARCELRFRKQTSAAILIQSHCRKYLAQHHFMNLKKAAIATQCAWRGKVARQELRQLKMAARETGALQAAKNKLEKQVEDLTLRLQLEKRLRVDIEDAKKQENEKLQSALQEMQLQFKETKLLLQKEREAAKREAERVPVIQEIPVVDHALMEKLTNENETLKTLVSSLEKKIDETEKRYEEANKISEERLKQALDAESKIIQLKTTMQRLEEKFLDMESENQVLRQQSLLNSPVKTISEHLSTHVYEKLENGHHMAEDQKASEAQNVTPVKKFGTEADSKLRRSYIERQHENVDALVNCVMKNIGFHHGKPVAAFTIYKCLLHWKSFEAERTSVFDRLIQMIGSAIENQDDNDLMAYWLSNTSALLFLLQQSLKSSGANDATPARKPPNPTSLFGRMTMGFRSSPSSANLPAPALEVVRKVEAKYPALLFKQQLTAYVEKIYGILRDNLKKELASFISSCLQAPRASKGVLRSGRSFGKDSPMGHWQSIIESLNTLLCTLKENFVPPVLIQKIFTQTFSYINVQLFNSLLLRRDCCTFSNGEYVKAGLAELELWCCQAKEEYAGSSWDELKHIRQAVGFLVIHQKYRISYDEIINDLCPIMSVQQLYRICTLYWDANYNTRSVSPDVLSSMRVLMAEDSNNAQSDSFLLDDSSSIPFSVDDFSTSLQEKDFSDMKPADELLENPAFQFLNE